MSAPFRYQIVYDETTHDVGKFTSEIDTALDLVESYNWNIKVCNAKWKQAILIAANLAADPYNPTIVRANIEVQDTDRERTRLENERQVVLHSVDQAVRRLEGQREIGSSLAARLGDEDRGLHRDALLAVRQWDADIVRLQLRRDVVGHTPSMGQSPLGDPATPGQLTSI